IELPAVIVEWLAGNEGEVGRYMGGVNLQRLRFVHAESERVERGRRKHAVSLDRQVLILGGNGALQNGKGTRQRHVTAVTRVAAKDGLLRRKTVIHSSREI